MRTYRCECKIIAPLILALFITCALGCGRLSSNVACIGVNNYIVDVPSTGDYIGKLEVKIVKAPAAQEFGILDNPYSYYPYYGNGDKVRVSSTFMADVIVKAPYDHIVINQEGMKVWFCEYLYHQEGRRFYIVPKKSWYHYPCQLMMIITTPVDVICALPNIIVAPFLSGFRVGP